MSLWTRESLLEAVRAGACPSFLLFYGHRARPDGALGAGCLSQWWPAPFSAGEERFATAEHWMMAEKARLFGDLEARGRILNAATPAAAKRLGRLVRGFDGLRWNAARRAIVVEGSLRKFSSTPALRAFLLDTGDRILVEASPTDRIWGIGLSAGSPAAQDPARWRGENLLGFALMEARSLLAAGVDPSALGR